MLQGSSVIKKWESRCLCPPVFAAYHGAVRSWWLSLEQDDELYLPSEMACKLCLLLKEDFTWGQGKALLIVAGCAGWFLSGAVLGLPSLGWQWVGLLTAEPKLRLSLPGVPSR